tara:strand:- start:500 stop:2092 length:1593 start_codon:yes stop_codon:yes gene_type:complete
MAKVETERYFGKKGIIIMIRDGNKMVSAIFKDKKNADKFNRNKPADVKKLLQLAKKTKFPKAIDESLYEGYFSTLDQIRKDSKDVRDFVKNVFADRDFKRMKNDKEFIKYLKSIYEGFASDAQRRAAFASGYKAKGKKGKKKNESVHEDATFGGKYNQKALKTKMFSHHFGSRRGRYVIDWYDGKGKHKDGSPFVGISISKNKKDLAYKVVDFYKKGYIQVSDVYKALETDPSKLKIESVNEGYGDWVKAKNLTDIIKLSKQKKNATFYVTDDNNSRIGSFYLKNGKFAKATTANPNYDLQRNKTKLKDRSDVIYKYKVDESVNEGSMDWEKHFKGYNEKELKVISKFIFMNPQGIDGVIKMSKHKPRDFKKTIQKAAKAGLHEGSKEALGIAKLTGARGVAIDDFIKKHNIDAKKLFNYVKKGNLQDRLGFITALVGKPNNKFFKMVIGRFAESIDESKTKESKVIQMIYKYAPKEKKFYDKMAEHERRIGTRQYQMFIGRALQGFGINPRQFKSIPDAEEKLYQTVSK